MKQILRSLFLKNYFKIIQKRNHLKKKMWENRGRKSEEFMRFQRTPEFLFFHDYNQIERIKEEPDPKEKEYWTQKWNAFKLMDVDVYRYFKILARGKLSENIFK